MPPGTYVCYFYEASPSRDFSFDIPAYPGLIDDLVYFERGVVRNNIGALPKWKPTGLHL
jgi:hypothetical protein